MRARMMAAAPLSAMLGLWAARALAGQEAPVPVTSVRAFAGEAAGVGAQLWCEQWVRADFSVGTLTVTSFDWASAALIVRLGGTPRRFIGLRAGYQLEYDTESVGAWIGSRAANAVDGAIVARIESARGSALEGQLGVEEVFRSSAASCCDDAALPKTSAGVRVSVVGELAVWDELALFGQAELRTGAHVMEIYWLPTAALGIRYRF